MDYNIFLNKSAENSDIILNPLYSEGVVSKIRRRKQISNFKTINAMKKIGIIIMLALSLTAYKNESRNTNIKNEIAMNTTTINPTELDKKNIQEVVERLFTATDNRDWSVVKATMADSVYIDYTALGGSNGFKTPAEIIDVWQHVLPGFDRTVHHPHNFAIWSVGDRATATFDGHAVHYLANDIWSVFVGYDTEYIKDNGIWKIARIDVSLYQQSGNTSLPQKAIAVVKNDAVKILPQADLEKKAVIEAFFLALENRNLENVLATLDNDAIQEMPFAPENFPKVLEGINAFKNQYSGVMEYEQSYKVEYFGTNNPNDIIAKFSGRVTTNEGKPYNNSYIGVFTVKENKITKFIEHFNPKILLKSWPGLQPASYSVHDAGAATNSGVRLEKVVFNSNGVNLKGHLFLPPNFNTAEKYPATIVTGSWTSVKEQMPDTYASIMAKEGFITLTFDFRGFGESEGQPRQVEDYNIKIEDIKAAVGYLAAHPNVDVAQLSGLGVCASAGYMAYATAQDKRIKQLVMVAPWLHNPEIARTIYDMRPGGAEGLLKAAKKAKIKYASTGEMDYVLATSELDPLSAMYVPTNAFDYYLNPAKAAGKKYDNRFAVSSWESWLTFDGISAGKEIQQPVFIVHSENGALPQGTKDFYKLLRGKKDIIWLNAFSQQQLYFQADAVNAAMNKVIEFLK